MEFSEVVRRRRMVRRFDPDRAVPEPVLHRALAHAVRAPSAGFSQGWDFVVLTCPAAREAFWAACVPAGVGAGPGARGRWLTGMRTAPVLVLCLADEDRYRRRYARSDKAGAGQSFPVPWWDVDTAMAALLVLLTATDEGLAGCFFGVPQPRWAQLRAAFAVPTDRRPVGVVALGHPAPEETSRPAAGRRRPLAETTHWNRFGVPPPFPSG